MAHIVCSMGIWFVFSDEGDCEPNTEDEPDGEFRSLESAKRWCAENNLFVEVVLNYDE